MGYADIIKARKSMKSLKVFLKIVLVLIYQNIVFEILFQLKDL